MLRKEQNGLMWLEFTLLQDFANVKHAVFTRHGGISTGAHASLNVAHNTGDTEENVQENRRRIADIFSPEGKACTLFAVTQVHGDVIQQITTTNPFAEPPTADVLTSDVPQAALLVKHADCQAALFYDPIHKACANVHAGWRGNVQDIYQKTIQMMHHCYGTKACDLFVCISPSLGPQASEFINYKTELPEEFLAFQTTGCYFDLWEISKWQLLQSGVLAHHIEIAGICTNKTAEDFFSYRREKQSGRNATVICLT